MPTAGPDTDELFELELLHKIDQQKLHLTGGIYHYGHEDGDHYDGSYCNDTLAELANTDEFVDIDDHGAPTLTLQGRGWLLHKTATGPVPTYTDPTQWPHRIGHDPLLIVELAFAHDPLLIVELAFAHEIVTLRALITEDATRYRRIATYSTLILTLVEATDIIDQRATNWAGSLDDNPRFVLPEACPHPLLDGFGQCEGCGGGPST